MNKNKSSNLIKGYETVRKITREEKQKVLDLIVNEIKELVEKNEEIWLDWDERETRKHAKFTVYGNYSSPHCRVRKSACC